MRGPQFTVTDSFHGAAESIITHLNHGSSFSQSIYLEANTPSWQELHDQLLAEQAIQAKAAQLGDLPGASVSAMQPGTKGWVQSFAGCDIYYNEQIGAFEVHGHIRDKFNQFHGMDGVLGLPLTDETVAPDGAGRYNHFQGGSIYWHPGTGPMMVRGPIRDVWAAQGWERGPLGYPVADEHRFAPLFPGDQPHVAWSLFENGAIVENAEGTYQALAADVTPDQLRCLVRSFVDREVHRSPHNIGLQPQTEILAVSGYGYDFWRALPRMITFRLHGFRDNGLWDDTDFELDLRLRFSLVWPMGLTEPATKTLAAALDWIRVHADGAGSEQIANGLLDGIRGAFFRGGPDPGHPEVPDGAVFITSLPTGADQTGSGNIDVVDVMVTAQGGLQVLVPVGPVWGGNIGTIRQVVARDSIQRLLSEQGCG